MPQRQQATTLWTSLQCCDYPSVVGTGPCRGRTLKSCIHSRYYVEAYVLTAVCARKLFGWSWEDRSRVYHWFPLSTKATRERCVFCFGPCPSNNRVHTSFACDCQGPAPLHDSLHPHTVIEGSTCLKSRPTSHSPCRRTQLTANPRFDRLSRHNSRRR